MAAKNLYQVKVEQVRTCARDTYLLTFYEKNIASNSRSGQFVEIRIPDCPDVLWRRPFSIHNTEPQAGKVEILFHAVGRGTNVLAAIQQETGLDVIGPLGNNFVIDAATERAVVVAGGLGIAPFKLMQKELAQLGIPMTLFYGAGSTEQMCDLEFFRTNTDLRLSTDDGSLGHHGLVTELLDDYLRQSQDLKKKAIFVCGPTPMMRAVQEIVKEHDVPAQVTLETIMACGFGACVGCAVPMANPQAGVKEYFLACKDGPVFNMKDILIDD